MNTDSYSDKGIMLDLDDVLYPFSQALHTELTIHWELHEDYFTYWGKQRGASQSLYWQNMIRIEFLYSVCIPRKEDIQLLWELRKKYRLYYVTNRPKEVEFTTRNYLKRYNFPSPERLIFTRNKGLVCQTLDMSIGVEDMLHNVDSLIEYKVEPIIMAKPWNYHALSEYESKYNCRVIDDFQEVRGLLL